MPRCLVACPEPPVATRGGGIAIRQTFQSLSDLFCLDYLGAPVPEYGLPARAKPAAPALDWPLHGILRQKLNVARYGWHDIPEMIRALEEIDPNQYQLCFLEFPWYQRCAERFSKHGIPVLTRFHNVEQDVLRAQLVKTRKPGFLLRLPHVSRMEKKAMIHSSGFVFLTREDMERYAGLFPREMQGKPAFVIPVAVPERAPVHLTEDSSRTLLCTATLNYGPNREGVLWLAEKIWPQASRNLRLIIAGSRADDDLKRRLANIPGVQAFYDVTEEKMNRLFSVAAWSIAPVFWGSGMKVKVAEALSGGIIPVGTSHAFTGYEVTSGKNSFLFRNDAEAVRILSRIATLDSATIREMSADALALYRRNYSIQSSRVLYRKAVEEVIAATCTPGQQKGKLS